MSGQQKEPFGGEEEGGKGPPIVPLIRVLGTNHEERPLVFYTLHMIQTDFKNVFLSEKRLIRLNF